MSRKIAILGLVLALAGALVYWFGFRTGDGGGQKKSTAAAAGDDPWEKAGPATKQGGGGGDTKPQGPAPRLSFELDPEGTMLLEGSVLDEHDQPVAGAEVRISSSPGRTTRTDSDGSFSFDKLLGRTYQVRARAGDKIGSAMAKVVTKGEPVVIRLRQGKTLTVLVNDALTKKPIVGATVLRPDEDETDPAIRTGADGKAVLRGLADDWIRITASAPGYGPRTESKGIGGSDSEQTLEISLATGAAVSGRVVDERGAAIAGARVWAMDAANAWEGGGGERTAETTAKDGTFTIAALSQGSYLFFAKDESHAPAVTTPVTVSGDAPTTGVEIVMKAAATLAGVVVDQQGAPVAYATVRLSSKAYSADMVHRQAAADEQGAFEIKGLPRTALRVRAEGEEASSDAVDVDLATTPDKKDLRLVLDRTATISGIVVDDVNEPVAEANVSAYPDFLAGEVDWVMASTASATTDGDGRFTLKGLEDGKFRVWASRESGGARRTSGREGVATQTGATDVRLVLPAPGGITGTIVMENGEKPATAIVSAGWEDRVTARGGAFTMRELQPGSYDLRISGSEFAQKTKGDVEVKAGKVTDVGEIVVRRGRKISGKVVDGKGAPIPGARVMFGKMLFGDGKQTGSEDEDTSAQMGMRSALTGPDGTFTMGGVPRTSGSLLAEHATLGRSIAIKIPAGTEDIADVSVNVKGYGAVAGKVMFKGEPVAGAQVNAAPIGSSGQAVFVQSAQDGSFVIDKLPEGQTAISAMRSKGLGGTGGSRTVMIVAGQQADGTIVLPAGDVALTVKVVPRPGETVNAATVFLFRGVVSVKNGEQAMDAFLASNGVQGETGDTTLAVGGAAGMLMWLGAGGYPTFEELMPGEYSACVIPITGSIMDQQLMGRIFANLDKLDVFCKPARVTPAPAKQESSVTVPAMRPLPPEEDV
jgi:uncharacterized GH25 family protein